MKNIGKLAVLGAVLTASAFTATAHAVTISGTIFEGWSTAVPTTTVGLTAAGTFNATAINFCESVFIPCNTGSAYTVGGFLATDPTVSNIVYAGGHSGADSLINTLFEFKGSAFFTNGQTFTVAHDDGVYMTVGSTVVLSDPGPTNAVTQTYTYTGVTGMQNFDFIYGEVDGSPAVFQTTLADQTPEPSSLMLLGTGLMSGAGMLMRRRRIAA